MDDDDDDKHSYSKWMDNNDDCKVNNDKVKLAR